jgi:DNA-binding response OmpR family regulator
MISEQEILGAHILIVDDQASNLELLKQVLRDSGYLSVTSTTDSSSVCKLHAKNHYDLILLDLVMPIMDGFEVITGLKEIESSGYLPVLVITAQPEQKLKALAIGAKDFISKPFDLTEVKTRIRNMLEVRLLYLKLDKLNKVLENYNEMLGQTVLERTSQLCESEERFRRLTELSTDWYWEQNKDGQFTKIFAPLSEVQNKQNESTREDQGAHREKTNQTLLEERDIGDQPFVDSVYSRTNSDGKQQFLMLSGESMHDLSGRFTGFRGIGKDVTQTMLAHHKSTASA